MRPFAALALGLALCSACKPDVGMVGGDPLDMMSSADLPWTAMDQGGDQAINECAAVESVGRQEPAAMLVVLDRSSSMSDNNKWAVAAQSIVQALDQDVFDTMAVGLYAAPSGDVTGPMCIFGFPVACAAPPFPQVDLMLAGTTKSSDAMGVRRSIKSWLTTNNPDMGLGDASPLYAAMENSIKALQGWNGGQKRLMLVVTDGTLSCNQFSKRGGFPDCNGCDHDWEDPTNIVNLLKGANSDPSKPVETFIVGVPGADTFDPKGCNFPPYRMRNALSAIAYAGSPNNVPANCTGKTFMKDGLDPAVSCHFDMTQGGFQAKALSDTITAIRGKALGCTFDLPTAPDGSMVNRFQINVEYDTPTSGLKKLIRRRDNTNQCFGTGCWDYDKEGRIELIGAACADVKGVTNARVKIVVGCDTVIG